MSSGKSNFLSNLPDLADNTVTTPATDLYFSLHTASVGPTGDQTTNEISYTGYARVDVARTMGGFAIAGETIEPLADIMFPTSTGGTGGMATDFAVGLSSTGAGVVLYYGSIDPPIFIMSGVTPELTTLSTINEA